MKYSPPVDYTTIEDNARVNVIDKAGFVLMVDDSNRFLHR